MKTKLLCLVCVALVILLLPRSTGAVFQQKNFRYVTGNNLVKYMRAYEKIHSSNAPLSDYSDFHPSGMFVGYVAGVQDATNYYYSIPVGTPLSQLCAIVAKFLKEHPERWGESASELVFDALKKAFPKKKH